MARDATDRLLDRWTEQRPEVDIGRTGVSARLSRLGRHVALIEEEAFGRFGVNRGEVGVLSALRIRAGPPHRLSPTRLGRGLLMSSAGMTSRLDRLERRGLVVRLPDPDDRRGILVELTTAGSEVVDAAAGAHGAIERRLLEKLEPGEIAQLDLMLRKVLSTVELPEPD